MSRRLSKSKYQKGLQCEKALWLAVHRPDLADAITETKQWVFDQGSEVGRLAQQLFPGGVEVTEDYLHPSEALDTTQRLLAEGARVLYEPAFFHDDVFVRVDVLVATEDGSWDLYEVKSSGSLKPEHVTDAAVQTYVVEGAGLDVRDSNVVHLDTSYVYEGGEYDLQSLFAVERVTEEVRAYVPEVPAQIERFRTLLAGPEPEMRVGVRCRKPYDCDFAGYCHSFMPAEHPVTDLPYLSEQALHALLDIGVTCIKDIPNSFGLLTANQAQTVDVVKCGQPHVDVDGLRRDVSRLEWPVYHLDFETVNPALPLWPRTSPYEIIPFQYSIHVHREDGTYEHREHLELGEGDPRSALAERMLEDLGTEGSVTHYTSYETKRIDALIEALPESAGRLAAVRDRLVDLEPIIKKNTKHPDACGRTSIKYVLPAWCPDMSYGDLGIQDGQTASIRYLKARRGLVEPEEAEATYACLIDYCERDTFAMVRLLEALLERSR